MPVPTPRLHPGACRLTQTHKLTFIQKGQDGLPHSSRIEYFVHGWFNRFENDKGLQYAKWCALPLMLRCNSQKAIHEAIHALDDARDEAHDRAVEAWHCEMDICRQRRAWCRRAFKQRRKPPTANEQRYR
jgi:hypothetical protein